MATGNYEYLGTSVKYPVVLENGKLQIVSGLSVIESSIIKILTTPLGTRYFLPEYGSRLNELLFEPNDQILLRLLRTSILAALTQWETRAKFLDVEAIAGEDIILCDIKYQILPANQVQSFVYPFYKSLVW